MNNLGSIVKYGVIAAVIGVVIFNNSNDSDYAKDEIDLNLVLDVTVDTLHTYQKQLDAKNVSQSSQATKASQAEADQAFIGFADALGVNYNKSQPAIYKSSIGVSPQTDASLIAYDDANVNRKLDKDEVLLFKIEIDGEKARIIASSRSGAVNDHYFSGSSLLTGYLIGSLLSRQRSAGVSSKSLASKKPVTSKAAAKARAGSGSHSKGK